MTDNPYTIDCEAGGDRIILMCHGTELAVVDTVDEAAAKAAADMIAGYPESSHHILYDVAVENGQMLGNVIHMRWFRETLAENIAGDWPSVTPMVTPTPGR